MGWNMFLRKYEPREIISLCRSKRARVCVWGGGVFKQFGLRRTMMLQKLKITI